MTMEGIYIPGVSRQKLKEIKAMSIPELRLWILEYSTNVYNLGINDCKEALRKEFGFGPGRLKRMTDHIQKEMEDFTREAGK